MKKNSFALTELSVRRPVLISVVNILVMLTGLVAILGVDVRELPDVDRPVVTVVADYPGASPETMDSDVTSVLEGSISRVAGVESIESSSEENNMRIRVQFKIGTDLNAAANDVREAVSRIQRRLPTEVENLLVIKADNNASAIVQLSVFSDILSNQALAERVEKDITPALLSIDGVADVQINGDQPSQLKVLIDPVKLASYRIPISDVITTLETARFDVPAGSYQSSGQELIVRTYASVVNSEAISNLQIKKNVRIGDIADVVLLPKELESYSLLNGRMVIGVNIIRQAGANTIAISNEVKRRVNEMNERSRDFTIHTTVDDADYIKGALKEVVYTLLISVAIVLVVIALFLGQLKAVLIPAVTMPISIIGTITLIYLFGFSINLLTLLALVLATGLIVDDAIVVLENIQRVRSEGLKNMAAAVIGTNQVFFAVIATTVTLVSVFLPIAFLPGETGQLFTEFGMVLVIAVIISSFVALTLCPMMAAKILKTNDTTTFFTPLQQSLQKIGNAGIDFYFILLKAVLHHRFIALGVAILIAFLGVAGFKSLTQELLPKEDRGAIRIFITAPDGSSLSYTDSQSQIIEEALIPYQNEGLITDVFSIVGRWDKNRVFTIATLADFSNRSISQMELAAELEKKITDIPGAQVRIFQTSSLGWRAARGGIELAILGNNYNDLVNQAEELSERLKTDIPEINNVRIDFDTSQPELSFNINRERAKDLNVPIERIAQSLRVMVDEISVIDLNINDQTIPIVMAPKQGIDTQDLMNIFITNTNGNLVPLSSLIQVRESGVAAELDRYAQRRAIMLDLGVTSGAPIGKIVNEVRRVADEVLPIGTSVAFLGEAATFEQSQNDMALTFVIALVVIFLVLAAQFESFGSAIIVIFTVPFGLAAAVFALILSNQSLNLYSQIGLILLIGLMTKNAILLVELMDQMRDKGMEIYDAILEGTRLRLRPVVMTVLSTVFGSLPLVLSFGAGAEARSAIGWVIFGGLGLSAVFTLFLTPLGYSLLAPYVKPRAHYTKELEQQLEKASQVNTNPS